jgi:polyribonucleotide nucleotidyltransferase
MNYKDEIAVDTLSMKFSTGTLVKQYNGRVCVTAGEKAVLVTATALNVLPPD